MAKKSLTLTASDLAKAKSDALYNMRQETPRAVAVVGGALVDDELELCLRRHLVATTSKHRDLTDNIFRPSGPIGSFSVKIDLGLLLSIYTKPFWNNLVHIKQIRNLFAHDITVANFEDEDAKKICAGLTYFDQYITHGDLAYRFEIKFPHTGTTYSEAIPHGFQPTASLRERYIVSCILSVNLLSFITPSHPGYAPQF